jgi:calcium/calmodulin-dependent protein kinase I
MGGGTSRFRKAKTTSDGYSPASRNWSPDLYASSDGSMPLPVVTESIMEDWSLTDKLGIGSTSTVYKCISKSVPELSCACKVMNKRKLGVSKARQDAIIKLAKNEVDLMTKLDHECIVRLMGSYETKTDLYVITELMTGGELLDIVMDISVLNDRDALKVIRRVAAGVLHLHKIGIMHRDIKPENILLKSKGDLDSVKLVDFGLSKSATTTKSFIGTQGYLAPEMNKRRKEYTPAVDMWALGVTMYAIMTGCLPYDDDQEAENQEKQNIEAAFPDDMWGDRDKRAVDCIRRLLQIDPTKRLTAEELCKHPWLKQGLTADDGKADSAMPEVMPPRAHTASEEYFQGQKKALPVETASTAPPKGASPYIVPEDPPPEETLEAGGAAESAPLMKKRLSFSHRDLETGDLVYKDENGVVVAETVAATPEEEAAPIASGEETAVAPPIEE